MTRPCGFPALLLSVICFALGSTIVYIAWFTLAKVGFVHPSCIPFSYAKPARYPEHCTLNTCFDFSQCQRPSLSDPIPVYIYPKMGINTSWPEFIDPAINIVIYDSIIYAVQQLPWVRVTRDPAEACLLFPHVQDLQGLGLHSHAEVSLASMLPYWNEGKNHVIFEFTDYDLPHFDAGKALLLRSNCKRYFCREGYDMAVPIYQRFRLPNHFNEAPPALSGRPYLLSFKGTRSRDKPYRNLISEIHNGNDILILVACHADGWLPIVDGACDDEQMRLDTHTYTELLVNSTFSLVPEGTAPHSYRLFEVMQAGSIPVIISDDFVLPLSEIIDWRSISIHMPISQIGKLPEFLRSIPQHRVEEMQREVRRAWETFFQTFELGVQWSVELLRRRIYNAELVDDYAPFTVETTDIVRRYPIIIPAP